MTVVYQIKFSIILSIIIVSGLVGNIINLFVFYQKKTTRKNSTFKYLFYLAFIDILVLLIAATDSLFTYGYSITLRLHSLFSCKMYTFLSCFLTHLSSFVLMIVSIDRAIIICQKTQSTQRINYLISDITTKIGGQFTKTRKVLLCLILFLVGINLHFIVFLTINKIDHTLLNETNLYMGKMDDLKLFNSSIISFKSINQNYSSHFFICYPLENRIYSYFLINIWIWIDAFIYSLIPFLVMSICSILIIIEIKSKSKSFIKTCQVENSRSTNQKICKKSKRRNRKLSMMLLFNNLFFILCSLPFRLNMLYYNYRGDDKDVTYSFQAYFHILAYSNNSFNFIFYFVFSNKYRQIISDFFFKKTQINIRKEVKTYFFESRLNNLFKSQPNTVNSPMPPGSTLSQRRKTSKLSNQFVIIYTPDLDLDQIKIID
jgi:hypothetical protein